MVPYAPIWEDCHNKDGIAEIGRPFPHSESEIPVSHGRPKPYPSAPIAQLSDTLATHLNLV
jgi:hypothetical protein